MRGGEGEHRVASNNNFLYLFQLEKLLVVFVL